MSIFGAEKPTKNSDRFCVDFEATIFLRHVIHVNIRSINDDENLLAVVISRPALLYLRNHGYSLQVCFVQVTQ